MTTNFCVYLDAGHGAIDPATGNYVTPGKRYRHSQGTFHGDGNFYEGVFNREIVVRVAAKLQQLGIFHKIVSHSYLDYSLSYRTSTANFYHREYKPGVFVSSHANAFNSNARGFEIYSSPGVTRADTLAEMIYEEVDNLLSDHITLRSDLSDGDHDKEVSFFVLRETAMPAVLLEHLFFDNFEDATLLMREDIQDYFAEAQVRGIIRYVNRFHV